MKASISKGSVGELVLKVLIESGEMSAVEITELSECGNGKTIRTAISRLVQKGLVAKNSNQKPQTYFITEEGEQEYVALNPGADVELNDWSTSKDHEKQEQENEKEQPEITKPKTAKAEKPSAEVRIKQDGGKLKFTITIEIEGL
ncbi:BlaI/MecI/CopY family transcriptional regulator [Methanolobus sp. WCC1]|uniref:BlaI/MecI/CopY family transcriptional regulator n=1 Tax=unclassified Methanolobus TaxID=2629569 RepID=UPI00324BAA38